MLHALMMVNHPKPADCDVDDDSNRSQGQSELFCTLTRNLPLARPVATASNAWLPSMLRVRFGRKHLEEFVSYLESVLHGKFPVYRSLEVSSLHTLRRPHDIVTHDTR